MWDRERVRQKRHLNILRWRPKKSASPRPSDSENDSPVTWREQTEKEEEPICIVNIGADEEVTQTLIKGIEKAIDNYTMKLIMSFADNTSSHNF